MFLFLTLLFRFVCIWESSKELDNTYTGRRNVFAYILDLPMLVAESGWNEPTLKATFHHGLNNNLLTELAGQDGEATLNSLINPVT